MHIAKNYKTENHLKEDILDYMELMRDNRALLHYKGVLHMTSKHYEMSIEDIQKIIVA